MREKTMIYHVRNAVNRKRNDWGEAGEMK